MKMEVDKTVFSFFCLFLVVYFLEAIGGFYMTSAIVYIERGDILSLKEYQLSESILSMSFISGSSKSQARFPG
jgi:hypothetical protein